MISAGVCTFSFNSLRQPEAAATHGIPCPATFDGLIDLATRYGLSVAEAPLPPDTTLTEANRLRDRAAEAGIRLVLAGGIIAKSPLEQMIPLAAALGARTLRLTISGILEGDRSSVGLSGWLEMRDAAIRRLREVRSLAEHHDVALAVENHQDADSDDLLAICEGVGGEHIGVNLDTGNPLAVGEGVVEFATRIAPFLKNAHLKEYRMHRTPAGFRLVRCAVGAGVVDFPGLFHLFATHAPSATYSIELGATTARHIRLLDEAWWSHFPARPIERLLPALRTLQESGLPEQAEWRTPHEREASEGERCVYEMQEFEQSVEFLKMVLSPPCNSRSEPATEEGTQA